MISDFLLSANEDGFLNVSLQAPTPVGSWDVVYEQSLRKGGIPFIRKCAGVGFGGGQSGVIVSDSGKGRWQVLLYAADFNNSGAQAIFPDAMSGFPLQNNYWRFGRLSSGFLTTLSEGFRITGG